MNDSWSVPFKSRSMETSATASWLPYLVVLADLHRRYCAFRLVSEVINNCRSGVTSLEFVLQQ
jgi:hypothetical protein